MCSGQRLQETNPLCACILNPVTLPYLGEMVPCSMLHARLSYNLPFDHLISQPLRSAPATAHCTPGDH